MTPREENMVISRFVALQHFLKRQCRWQYPKSINHKYLMGKTRFLTIHKTVVILRYFDVWSGPPSKGRRTTRVAVYGTREMDLCSFCSIEEFEWTLAVDALYKSKWIRVWNDLVGDSIIAQGATLSTPTTRCWRVSKGHYNIWTQAIS